MADMTLDQVKAAFGKLEQPRMVTVIQYHRDVYVYEPGDSRIAGRVAWLNEAHQTQNVAAMFIPAGIREKRIFELSQRHVDVFDAEHDRLTSDEMRVEMMDALMSVHNFLDGAVCC